MLRVEHALHATTTISSVETLAQPAELTAKHAPATQSVLSATPASMSTVMPAPVVAQ